MKKLLLCAILACCSLCMWAAKSAGTPMVVLQPDGKFVTIQLLGDEDFSWYQTTDGVILVWEKSAYYVANITNGELKSTGVLAHDASDRDKKEKALGASQDRNSLFSQADKSVRTRRNAMAKMDKANFCPHMGEVHIPVIMMNYKDMKFSLGGGSKSNLYKIFDEYFNSTKKTPYTFETRYQGYSSVRQYFTDASNGKFTPVFDLYGPYDASRVHDYYGKKGGKSYDLMTEAVKIADADIDFSKYDSNKDGNVDFVCVLHAGYGATFSNNMMDVWPSCWHNCSIETKDGKTVNVIAATSELIETGALEKIPAGIGVFCHEMSHGLGMPDLYWTLKDMPMDENGNIDFDNCGPEDWDLMDGGENIYNGFWPCQYTAWEREYMGWVENEEITEPQNITLIPQNKGGKAYKISNPADPYEYYTIEHTGYDGWNYYLNKLYGNGMLIMHLRSSAKGFSMTPNNTYGCPNVTLVPADGKIVAFNSYVYFSSVSYADYTNSLKGDVYPGLKNVTSVKKFNNYSGKDMVRSFPITNIVKNADQSVSFRFMGGVCNLVDGKVFKNDVTEKYGKITYTREYSNQNWKAFYVPFSMSYEDWCDDFYVARINKTLEDSSGKLKTIEVVHIDAGTIEPNTPYAIKEKVSGTKTITLRDAYLYESDENTLTFNTDNNTYVFHGTYAGVSKEELYANRDTYYCIFSNGGFSHPKETTGSLKPFRWYFERLEKQSKSKGMDSWINISDDMLDGVRIIEVDEATGISEEVKSDNAVRDNYLYDINGRRMNSSDLKPGIYIMNGRKYIK